MRVVMLQSMAGRAAGSVVSSRSWRTAAAGSAHRSGDYTRITTLDAQVPPRLPQSRHRPPPSAAGSPPTFSQMCAEPLLDSADIHLLWSDLFDNLIEYRSSLKACSLH